MEEKILKVMINESNLIQDLRIKESQAGRPTDLSNELIKFGVSRLKGMIDIADACGIDRREFNWVFLID